jgi:hypothetical protein
MKLKLELEKKMKQLFARENTPVKQLGLQRGASLLEGIAYLGIAAIVILGAVSLLTNAFSSAQTNRVVEELTALRTTVKKLYTGQPAGYGSGDLTATLISAKAHPATLTSNADGTELVNSWNGSVTVDGDSSTFTISYSGVPQNACINILSGATGWLSVTPNSGTAIAAFPITPAAAATACSVTSSAGNTLDFEAS